MTASEVAMNSALPRPQPARKPTIWLIVSELAAASENATISDSPTMSVRLAPIRLDTQPVISIATAKTHVSRALRKVDARDRAQLVALAYETGLVHPRRDGVLPGAAYLASLAALSLLVFVLAGSALTASHQIGVPRGYVVALVPAVMFAGCQLSRALLVLRDLPGFEPAGDLPYLVP